MDLKRCEAIVLLTLSSISYECWASVGLAAEPPSTPIADTLLDQAADRLPVTESSVVRAPAMGMLAPMEIPVRETDGDETRGHILRPVAATISDATLDPVGMLESVAVVPAVESRLASASETAAAVSALSGFPRQGVMTLDLGYRDAMPGGPPSDHP